MRVVRARASFAVVLRGSLGLVLGAPLVACGGTDGTAAGPGASSTSGGSGGCVPGELELADGRCLAAGMQENGCAAGEVAEDGGCRSAGIPPDACGQGFAPDEDGSCTPSLPAGPCPEGQMAIPGETTCREIAPCGTAPWGDIPVDASTEFVDGAYTGGGSDGSSVKPWTTIQDAVDAAEPGATVAIAEGSYAESVVILNKPVRLWGRCPAKVEVVGGASPTTVLVQDADATELHDLAVQSGEVGLAVAAEDVVVERVWIHDTAGPGVYVEDAFGPSRVTLMGSLIESAREQGAVFIGSEATIEETVVRDTRSAGTALATGVAIDVDPGTNRRANVNAISSVFEGNHGHGIEVVGSDASIESTAVRDTQPNESDLLSGRGVVIEDGAGERASVTLRASTIERSHDIGVFVAGSDATVEATVVRDTQPRASDDRLGRGINVEDNPGSGERSNVTIRSAAIEDNYAIGLYVIASDLTVEGTVVRDTKPQASDQVGGRGIDVENDPATGRASATLRSSIVERNHEYGVIALGSDLTLEGVVVRDTQPQASDSARGPGVAVDGSTDVAAGASVTMRASLIEGSHQVGLLVSGSHADIETTVVRDTKPQASDERFGRGIQLQPTLGTAVQSTATVRACVVERNVDVGIAAVSSDATVDRTVVRDTGPSALDGAFGDGVASISDLGPARAVVTSSRIERSARAGISCFGASVELGTTALDCNTIDLDGEEYEAQMWSFADRGGAVCGCMGEERECIARSSGLDAPDAIDAPSAGP